MVTINSAQDSEVTFLSGVTAIGVVAGTSYGSWNSDEPATYGPNSDAAKWGSAVAGTGVTVAYAFDAASNWTATEKAAFVSALHLWSAVANISFTESPASRSRILIERGSDGGASGGGSVRPGLIGSHSLGVISSGEISIDTSVRAFGPIGASFATYGGYPWTTVIHEIGHAIGLGHGGAYDDGVTTSETPFTQYDSVAWTVMSYLPETRSNGTEQAVRSGFGWGTSTTNGYTYGNSPTTPMPLDILAVQRLYGVRTDGPLSGGQVFGFHTNVAGDIAKFFDFTINTQPVVTIWDSGTNNTLDLSGFTAASAVDLHAGSFSSVGGLTNNLAIAYDTRIDTVIGGAGADVLRGNDNGDVIMGGAGADTLTGGSGNDHIYGNATGSVQGATDGADMIDAGAGSNYVNGNAGADVISAADGSNRLYGGAGNDTITAGNGNNTVNGNLGDDVIRLGDGNNVARGGQGNDTLTVGNGNNQLFGDFGNDVLQAGSGNIPGSGVNFMTGGGGADLFVFHRGGALYQAGGPIDQVTDFTDGEDKLNLQITLPRADQVLHDGAVYADVAAAKAGAQALLAATAVVGEIAAMQVGNDTYLFWNEASNSDTITSVLWLANLRASAIDASDFTSSYGHL